VKRSTFEVTSSPDRGMVTGNGRPNRTTPTHQLNLWGGRPETRKGHGGGHNSTREGNGAGLTVEWTGAKIILHRGLRGRAAGKEKPWGPPLEKRTATGQIRFAGDTHPHVRIDLHHCWSGTKGDQKRKRGLDSRKKKEKPKIKVWKAKVHSNSKENWTKRRGRMNLVLHKESNSRKGQGEGSRKSENFKGSVNSVWA